jgi:serine/threonine protein kinase
MKGKFNVINDISNDAKHLIKCLLEVDPRKRISVQSILNHPWLVNVDVSNTKNYNLFTNAERVLLAKSNVDYRDINNKDDIIENFDLKNLDTGEETENKNINTKSIILAPFNSSMSEEENKYIINNTKIKNSEDDYNNKELIIKNNVIKFSVKVKELNRNYELNNNGEIDNGVVISPNDSHEKKKENNDISPYNGSYYSKIQSKPFSPFNEMEEGLSSRRENKDDKNNNTINDKALSELCELGYNKKYVIDCINKNDINYATAGYYLLDKFS